MTKREQNKLDKLIEASYYAQANGRQINVMKIGKLFQDARVAIVSGVPVDQAVAAAIETHCEPVGTV